MYNNKDRTRKGGDRQTMKPLWNQLKAKLGHIRRRTVILAVVATLLFLLPTALAIGWALDEDTPTQKTVFSVTVFDQNHKQIALETASEDPTNGTNMADVLYRVITEGKQIDRAPFLPEDGTPIYISVAHNGTTAEYTCYFSVSGEDSYYINSSNQIFLIAGSAAMDFLALPQAETLYRVAEPPALFTNTEDVIVPTTAEWFYKLRNDTFQQAKNCETTEEVRSYEFVGALELRFADEPDFCLIRAVDSNTGRLVYEGSYQELARITVTPGTALNIHLRAEWKEQQTAVCHGALSYDFAAVLRERSSFSLNRDTLAPGEFLILTCTNIRTLDKLVFMCEDNLTRYNHTDGNTLFCVIPYPTDAKTDTLDFTVTYGASTKRFTVALLNAPTESTFEIASPNSTILAAVTASAQSSADRLLQTVFTPTSQTIYFQGNILSFEERGFTRGYRFDDRIMISGNADAIEAKGTEYLAASGTAVPALCAGEVVATGYCDTLGNYAVLNHGLGIQTWYAHLSDLDVRTGDIVAVGESVGKSGVGGVYSGSGVLLLCTVGGHLCDPASLEK